MISGVGWTFTEKLVTQLVSTIVSIVLARILAPEYYGVISIATVFLTICNVLADGGFGNALVQKKDATDVDFSSIFWLSTGLSVILYLVIFTTAGVIADFYQNSEIALVLQVMGLRIIIAAISSIQTAYVQKHMLFKQLFYIHFGSSIASGIIGIVMAYAGFGVWALVTQTLSATVLSMVFTFVKIGWYPKFVISIESIRSLWGYGSKVLLSTVTSTVKDNIRSLVIGKKFSSADLAYYNQGQKYPALIVTDIVESIGRVMLPVMSNIQDDRKAVKELMKKSIRISAFILTPCVAGLIAVSDTFVRVLLTEKWIECVPYMRILALVYISRPLSTVFQKTLMAIGKSGELLFHEIVTSIATIVLLLLAVFVYSRIEYIAWSFVVVMVMGVAIQAHFVKHFFAYQYKEMLRDYMPSMLVSCCMCGIVLLVGTLNCADLLKLMLQITMGVVSYVGISALSKVKAYKETKEICKNLISARRRHPVGG